MLKGSRVLVTGGSSGIGRALATALCAEGAAVVVTGRDAKRLTEVADANSRIDAVVCDVTDADQIAALQQLISSTGGIDMLVNCAGVMHFFDVTSGTRSNVNCRRSTSTWRDRSAWSTPSSPDCSSDPPRS